MEQWKIIPFEENYEVSDKGRVRNSKTKHIKSLRKNKGGYLRVTLYPSGTTYSIHRLVALVWLAESYLEGLEVDHIDGNKENNNVQNLEWVTQQENIRRVHAAGRNADTKGVLNPQASISEDIALQIKYSFDLSNTAASKKFGCSLSVVEKIRRRERWKHIVDQELEEAWRSGTKKYTRSKTSNLDKEKAMLLQEDIDSGEYTVKELVEKYGVNKSTIYRRKRK